MTKTAKTGNPPISPRRSTRAAKRPKLRRVLPVPPEVAEIVTSETARLPMTKEARQRLENNLTLQYHCGGDWVVCRKSRHGVEVLAAGWEDVRRFLRKTPLVEGTDLTMTLPDPWE